MPCPVNQPTGSSTTEPGSVLSRKHLPDRDEECLLLALCLAMLLPACSISLASWITGARNFLAAHCGKKERKGLQQQDTHMVYKCQQSQ